MRVCVRIWCIGERVGPDPTSEVGRGRILRLPQSRGGLQLDRLAGVEGLLLLDVGDDVVLEIRAEQSLVRIQGRIVLLSGSDGQERGQENLQANS